MPKSTKPPGLNDGHEINFGGDESLTIYSIKGGGIAILSNLKGEDTEDFDFAIDGFESTVMAFAAVFDFKSPKFEEAVRTAYEGIVNNLAE